MVTRAEKSTIWIQFESDYQAGRSYQIPQICLVQIFPEGTELMTDI